MAFRITTTGLQNPVVFYDLGARSYSHPTTDYDLELEYSQDKIAASFDVQNSIDNNWITVQDAFGNIITSTKQAISHNELSALNVDSHFQYALTTGTNRVELKANNPQDLQPLVYDSSSATYIESNDVNIHNIREIETLEFNTLLNHPQYKEGLVFWDNHNKTLGVYNDILGAPLQVGQETFLRVKNESGSNIQKGSPVRIVGACTECNLPLIDLSSSATHEEHFVIGLTAHDISDETEGLVTIQGVVYDFDTSNLIFGGQVYLGLQSGSLVSSSVSGTHNSVVGYATNVDSTAGSIVVLPRVGLHLGDLNDIDPGIMSAQNGDVLAFDSTSGLWTNSSTAAGTSGTSGTSGSNGSSGSSGSSGTSGSSGSSGASGTSGTSGSSGTSGTSGSSGSSGSSGTSGINGTSGSSGTSGINGTSGSSGSSGSSGTSGMSSEFSLSTGIIHGGILSVNDSTSFNVTSGFGIVVDYYTDPDNPDVTYVYWNDMTAVDALYINDGQTSAIALNKYAQVVQTTSQVFSPSELRDYIQLGVLIHSNYQTLQSVNQLVIPVYDPVRIFTDFIRAFGIFNISGNVYSANGNNLRINRSAGQSYTYSANYINNRKSPSIYNDNAATAPYFQVTYTVTPGVWGAYITNQINPNIYDTLSGTLSVPSGKWTIQKIFRTPSPDTTVIQIGQGYYDSITDALSHINDSFEINPAIVNIIFRGSLIVQEGTTDLSDSTSAVFVSAGKFGLVSGSTGGGAGGEINTASNVGLTGVGPFLQKSGVDLQFKNIYGTADITVTNDIANKAIQIGLTAGAGTSGTSGSSGSSGTSGLNGTSGTSGNSGSSGSSGTSGLSGTSGTSGLSGSSGSSGTSGDAGTSGSSGTSGTSQLPEDMPGVQVRRTTDYTLTTSFVDLTFDVTDIENQPSVVNHDDTNTERINIVESGLYQIGFACSVDADAGEDTFSFRVLVNGIDVAPGSLRTISEDDEINDVGCVFLIDLTSSDYVTFQGMTSGGTNVLITSSTYFAIKLQGPKGDQGPAGSGSTLNIQDEGTPITNTPHSALNFIGASVTATDGGGGVADITIAPVFGQFSDRASSDAESTTTSATYQQKTTLSVSGLVAGIYRVGWYAEMRCSSTGSDFLFRVQQDNTTDLANVNIEEKDTTNYYPISGFIYVTLLSSTAYTFDMDYANEAAGNTVYIRKARLEFWRVS